MPVTLAVIRETTTYTVSMLAVAEAINDYYRPVKPLSVQFRSGETVKVSTDPAAVGRKSRADMDAWTRGDNMPYGKRSTPTMQALLGLMCSNGIIKPGTYQIVVTREEQEVQRAYGSIRHLRRMLGESPRTYVPDSQAKQAELERLMAFVESTLPQMARHCGE